MAAIIIKCKQLQIRMKAKWSQLIQRVKKTIQTLKMGAEITIDKHLTNLEEWFQVTNKLDSIDFDADITSHIGLWKVTQNDKNQPITSPVFIETHSLDQLFSKHQCYVFYAIKKSQHQNPESFEPILSTQLNLCIENLKNHILKICYETSLKSNFVEGHQYRIYALFGKKSPPQLRLLTTSYCLKLNDALNSKKKLAIFSGGGVLRNKKLQKGSVLPFDCQQENQAGNFNIIKLNDNNSSIDFVKFFTEFSGSSYDERIKNSKRRPLSIFSFKSECQLPEIKTQKLQRPEPIEMAESEVSAYSSSKDFTDSQVIEEPKPQKKNEVKMNLKLDFSKPLNLSGLNLASKKSQTQQGSSNSIQNIGITNRSQQRRGKRQKCEQECSEIIQGLYVSGEKVARNYDTLQKHQIKYIINCAGDYCENWFEDKNIEYLTFFLKDSQNENIQCLFYKVIEFIQTAHKNKENVLVHCIQGISRSVTFVIAYIIFKYGYDYKKAESFVKQKRSIACPNNGFMVELIQFHKRLYDEYESLTNPRVFLVSSHSKETPHVLTARLLKVSLFDSKKYIGLDSRGIYVIHLPDIVYIWIGSKCSETKLQSYWAHANDFVKKLQKYQRAPLKVKTISEGSEQKDFLAIWNLTTPPKIYENQEYDRFFIEGQPARPGQQRQYYQQIEQEESQSKKLYIYPDHKTGLGVFSLEDLNGMCILSIVSEQNGEKLLKLHIWKNEQFQPEDDNSEEDFLSKVIQTNFADFDDENIEIIEEECDKPSQTFKDCFKN